MIMADLYERDGQAHFYAIRTAAAADERVLDMPLGNRSSRAVRDLLHVRLRALLATEFDWLASSLLTMAWASDGFHFHYWPEGGAAPDLSVSRPAPPLHARPSDAFLPKIDERVPVMKRWSPIWVLEEEATDAR